MADFVMPSLGADMDEGTLLEWLIKPGDVVHRGEAIAVVDTAKAAIEVESFADGTVEALIVEPGQTVPVGTVLAKIIETAVHEAPPAPPAPPAAAARLVRPASAAGAAAPAPAAKPAKGRAGRASAKRSQPAAAREVAPAAAAPQTRIAVPEPARAPAGTGSPLVRHLARDLGVDLATVHGTGQAGMVTRADVQHAARSATPRPPRASPRARQVAAELSVDLAAVTGTGPGGAIRESDVRRAARPAHSAASAARSDRLTAMRQATARLMARSKREIPHYYLSSTVDLATAVAWLHDRNRETDVAHRLVPAALLLKAAALAARAVPELNGFWVDEQFVPADGVHLGVAVSLRGGGLVTPAIHDAADLEPAELMHRLRDLVTRARTGRLRGSELTGGTITVTNLGDQGVESVHGVIYPPQVALVGFGKVAERPVAVGGLIGARPTVIATLAADHRATDGYTGARYLNTLCDLLQQPEEL